MSKRKAISLSDKLSIIEKVKRGDKKKEVAKNFGISFSTLSTVLKNEVKILKFAEASSNRSQKKLRKTKYGDVDKAMLKWVQINRERNLPLSGSIIKQKASDDAYFHLLKLEDFYNKTKNKTVHVQSKIDMFLIKK